MKKGIKVGLIATIGGIVMAPIAFFLFIYFVFLIGTNVIYYRHRPELVCQTDSVFTDSFGDVYFTNGQQCYKYKKDSKNYELAFFDSNLHRFPKKVVANDDYCFISQTDENGTYFISVLDKELNLIKKHVFYKDDNIIDIAEKDNVIYCLKSDKNTFARCLTKIEPLYSDDETFIANITEKTCSFEYSGTIISIDLRVLYENCITLLKEKTLFTYLWFNNLEIDCNDNQISIIYKNESFYLQKESSFNRLYRKKYLIGNTLLFGMYEKSENKECGSINTMFPCICSLGKSKLYSFDLVSKELKVLNEFDSGTFLIDYDLNKVGYYFNGGLYIDNTLVKSCDKIKEGDLEKIRGKNYFSDGEEKHKYYLSLMDNIFYGI